MDLTIQQEFDALPANLQREVADFIAFLRARYHVSAAPTTPPDPILAGRLQVLGSLKGQIWISPDFDEPLDDLADYQ